MTDTQYPTFSEDNYGFKNLSELKDDQIIEVEEFSDLPDDINELIITDPTGRPIFRFDTRVQIREFLEGRKQDAEARRQDAKTKLRK